ncbi:MAG: response regulator transcription factor [Gemmatimonadetes bacterium]|nr:response regulator transcription factor [Gemmatimonadota bacterium]MBT4609372.1 response regulator transcription factor [Gemmatimonadota bacterium]MBT5059113.1 response regulator transcription factor [Gemmatimonadota bacterium]MBT5146093.1 response regulator transcription factor [Gemmatimonadota bacterium]MBT5591828.1 response regulator transcription factor [Gemmatimonadota bacterium]
MTSQRILVVEDEPDILEIVSYNLRQSGFEPEPAKDGETALQMAEDLQPDLIILDLMLPGMDGLEVCRLLKQRDSVRHIPVIMLTAKAEEVDRIVGLELGADDYLTKPFSPRELVLRVKSILRRHQSTVEKSAAASSTLFEAGSLSVDPEGHQAYVSGIPLQLTATEFKLLLTLTRRRGRVQSREELLNVVWGYQHSGYERTVDTHVRRLREKLGEAQDWVETVRGVGYRFRKDPE